MRKTFRYGAAGRRYIAAALFLISYSKAALAESCTAELIGALTRLSAEDLELLRGDRIRGDYFKSQITLPGAYACEYKRTDAVSVTCTWIARSYERGKNMYAELNHILHGCSGITIKTEGDKPNGEQKTMAEFQSKRDSSRKVSIFIEHFDANQYSAIATREIAFSFLVDAEQ